MKKPYVEVTNKTRIVITKRSNGVYLAKQQIKLQGKWRIAAQATGRDANDALNRLLK